MRISDWSSDVCSSDLRAAAVEAHRHRAQLDAEDGADALEIVEHELEPVVVDAGLAIPGAGPFLRRVRKLVEAIDGGFDAFRHRDRLRRALRRASHWYRSMRTWRRSRDRGRARNRRRRWRADASRCWKKA